MNENSHSELQQIGTAELEHLRINCQKSIFFQYYLLSA